MMALPPLAFAAAFNLVCSGSTSTPAETRKFSDTFRIDLTAGRFCRSECKQTFPIKAVSAGEIILDEGFNAFFGTTHEIKINRETGTFYEHTKGTLAGLKLNDYTFGTCVRAVFTGFPVQRF